MTTPYTDPTHAHNVVAAAASDNDLSNPDRQLGIGMPATDPPQAPIALQRWESDGGAVR